MQLQFIPCAHCGAFFIRPAKYPDQRYCSQACSQTARRGQGRIPVADRFWDKIDRRGPDACWPWLAAKDKKGYGKLGAGGRGNGWLSAHRVAKELVDGPSPFPKMEIDHLCRNPSCCNPAHLEWVTHRENILRGIAPNVRAHLDGRCRRGHVLTPDNSRPNKYSSGRVCRQCDLEGYHRRARLARGETV